MRIDVKSRRIMCLKHNSGWALTFNRGECVFVIRVGSGGISDGEKETLYKDGECVCGSGAEFYGFNEDCNLLLVWEEKEL